MSLFWGRLILSSLRMVDDIIVDFVDQLDGSIVASARKFARSGGSSNCSVTIRHGDVSQTIDLPAALDAASFTLDGT